MSGGTELVEDKDLTRPHVRFKRREEFNAAVHAFTTKRTSAEVLEEAATWRIPAGPVLNGETVTGFEQFVARDVFVPSPSGRFKQPRVPYRISGLAPRAFAAAPEVGEHDGVVSWPTRGGVGDGSGEWALPLEGFRVVDLTAWWSGPSAPHALA